MKQMRRISVFWGIILILIVAVLTIIGINFNKPNKVYTDMEDYLVEAAKKYVEQSFLYPQDNKELRITHNELKDSGFIEKLEVDNNQCIGYVIVKNNELVYEYKGYVSCSDYQTKNYSN